MTDDPSNAEQEPNVDQVAEKSDVAAAQDEVVDTAESSDEGTTASDKPERSKNLRRTFSLSIIVCLLLILVLLLSGVFDTKSETPVVEISAPVLFEQLVGQVASGESKAIHVDSFVVDDEMIQSIRGLESVETLIVDQGVLNDPSMDVIASLPNLRHLRLRLSPISDEGLRTLSKCESLWFLNLPHANCTAEGIGALTALKHLRQLRLGSRQVGNEASREIAKITSLRGIHLIGIGLTDDGLKLLADMPHLESLYLDDSDVTNAGWEWVFSMKPQLHVHVDQQHHDRDPKAHSHH